ncbi:hypothetical protein CLV49_2422 [Labedella gwakjiensis]|uniref:Uncharacterized protein n=1 Tax=Labedella gwakjiensis TaxID=390269 RepID=A0A2P8GXV0_9MICO|nr:hypothetical protein [Labedella gwakjiensis]PSL38793.1 hypothetical protein CLV49_2422 [Labedella gwakjiensis]RUQ86733.1 hypothetical protein ELQ93_07120 [Labedella gwakjiensis]
MTSSEPTRGDRTTADHRPEESIPPVPGDVTSVRAQNTELRVRLADATAEIVALDDRLRAAKRELDDYRQQLRLMRGSRSWRVTRPLRILKKRVPETPAR